MEKKRKKIQIIGEGAFAIVLLRVISSSDAWLSKTREHVILKNYTGEGVFVKAVLRGILSSE